MGISDILNSSGIKGFKFEQPGASVIGTVIEAEARQVTNFDSGEAEFWDDGNKKMQIRITMQTTERDPMDPEDDGRRAVYVKTWGAQMEALRRAVKNSGADDILPGGTFGATYTGDGERKAGQRGFPPKMYDYTYQPPSATGGYLGGQGGGQQPPQQGYQQPPQQQAPTWAQQEAQRPPQQAPPQQGYGQQPQQGYGQQAPTSPEQAAAFENYRQQGGNPG